MRMFSLIAIIASFNSYANPETICGTSDDRVPSNDPKIARSSTVGGLYGCTVTMIGRSCAISAGHCVGVLEQANFNVPVNVDGTPQGSKPEDIYLRSKDYLRYKDNGRGNDWAVIKLNKNEITGQYPGDVQGWYPIQFATNYRKGDVVRITGYGSDEYNRDKNLTQQTNTGKIKAIGSWANKSTIQHTIDTMGGNSGSSILLERTGEIIGVHSHGGCTANGGANKGTLISKNQVFNSAVRACLDWEESL